ncbi:MAG: ParB/RepB/Spo0J family partition protein [Clostridia bacterium]|nr:ParB/RepB/Spo0J family partition protein [Clostridia bacterium]
MAKNSVSGLLTSVDELFTTQKERDEAKREAVVDILLSEISDFPDHPFKVRMDEAMMEMAESVKQYGVLVPGMVRAKPEGGYEMVAGHRRKMASEIAQMETMPCLVRELTDDEAIIIMVDSNLQRETLLPSEKAFAYRMKLEAMKRQGQRTDLTLSPVATKLDTASKVGQQAGESRDQVFRYIRLTYLIPPLLDMVDEGKIAMRPAVELSYLPEKEQEALFEIMGLEECTPSHVQAIKIRKFYEEGKLSSDVILSIMQEEKPNQKEQFRMPRERISKYFSPGTPAKTIEDTIIKALDLYRKRQRSMER